MMIDRYFDYAASAPPFEEALRVQSDASSTLFANPSSAHGQGTAANEAFLKAKNEFCQSCGFHDGRLLLCASGTEANNVIIQHFFNDNPNGQLLIAEDVHASIWFAVESYKQRTKVIPIDTNGNLNLSTMAKSSHEQLLCINHVCAETGTIHDLDKIGRLCKQHDIHLHIDGVQAMGHLHTNFNNLLFDTYSFSAHKFGGMRGVGGLLFRMPSLIPLIKGGNQEWGFHAGTENLGGLLGSCEALKRSNQSIEDETTRLKELEAKLLSKLTSAGVNVLINSPENHLPGLLSLSFPNIKGSEMVSALSLDNFCVSTGSACSDNTVHPPRIIKAIGRNDSEAIGTIRISMGRLTTEQATIELAEAIIKNLN